MTNSSSLYGGRKLLRLFLAFAIAALLLVLPVKEIPDLDDRSSEYFISAIVRAGVAYATCRTVNAAVSVLQESTLQVEPAGVGVSLAVGQILDPINDMTERVSSILVMVVVSLGVQKLIYEIAIYCVPLLLAVLLVVAGCLFLFDGRKVALLRRHIFMLMLFVSVFRFFLPLSAFCGDILAERFFNPQIAVVRENLAVGTKGIEELCNLSLPEVDGVMGTIENSASFLKEKSAAFRRALAVTSGNMEDLVQNLLNLAFLYVGFFVVQVVLLPLGFFWILYRLAISFFSAVFPNALFRQPAGR